MSSDQIHIYYPRGFRVLRYGDMPEQHARDHSVTELDGPRVVYSNGDEEVAAIYALYRSTDFTTDWETVERVLRCAKRLLGHLPSFFYFQAHNARVHGSAWEFLEQLRNYIQTGRSLMSPTMAFELIDDHPERDSAAIVNRKIAVDIPAFYRDPLAAWLDHEDEGNQGLNHLIESLYVLFGPARPEREKTLPIRTLSERKLTKGWMKILED